MVKSQKNKVRKEKKHQKKFSSNFIGRQLSRFKLGMSYLTLGMSSITAVMTTKEVYGDLQIETILAILLPVAVFGTIMLGFFLDKFNISSQDQLKSNEMTHRFLLTSDIKTQEFQMLQTKMLLAALQNLKDGRDINSGELLSMYDDYLLKWKSPDSQKT